MAKNKRKVFSVNITDKLGERMVSERYIVAIENEGSIPKIPVLNDLLRGLALSANFIFTRNKILTTRN